MNHAETVNTYALDGVVISFPDKSTSFLCGSDARKTVEACDSEGRFFNLTLPIGPDFTHPDITCSGQVKTVRVHMMSEKGLNYSPERDINLPYREFHPFREFQTIERVQKIFYRPTNPKLPSPR